jgi:hypothetical protein
MKTRHSLAALFSLFSIVVAGQASAALSSEDYPDLYASVIFDHAPTKSVDVAAHPGYGDSYGSILLDQPPAHTQDVAAQPGYGDSYGSILLDLPANSTSYSVAKQADSANSANI